MKIDVSVVLRRSVNPVMIQVELLHVGSRKHSPAIDSLNVCVKFCRMEKKTVTPLLLFMRFISNDCVTQVRGVINSLFVSVSASGPNVFDIQAEYSAAGRNRCLTFRLFCLLILCGICPEMSQKLDFVLFYFFTICLSRPCCLHWSFSFLRFHPSSRESKDIEVKICPVAALFTDVKHPVSFLREKGDVWLKSHTTHRWHHTQIPQNILVIQLVLILTDFLRVFFSLTLSWLHFQKTASSWLLFLLPLKLYNTDLHLDDIYGVLPPVFWLAGDLQ